MEIVQQPVPLQSDADGVVRVGGTRIPLETIIIAFAQGATAEEITQQFPSLALADVYAVISYYLHHQEDVERYVQQRSTQALHVREQNEARFNMNGIRERLLARQLNLS